MFYPFTWYNDKIKTLNLEIEKNLKFSICDGYIIKINYLNHNHKEIEYFINVKWIQLHVLKKLFLTHGLFLTDYIIRKKQYKNSSNLV